ncbi:MAG TPA: alpha-rhamnosidase, partial [Cyclobacteriaceae bacterium]|nr:alpha-rhamnosidase [Cyclobacteriaceae bacterium]
KTKIFTLFFLCGLLNGLSGQNPEILEKPWHAQWITTAEHSATAYGVYIFRKTMELTEVPENYIVHVSADNRYQLFVNGKMASAGPARGDLEHWNFETVDLKPYLRKGKNVLAARVWNEAEWRPEVQITAMTGFILQGNTSAEEVWNTGATWKCIRDDSYAPLKLNVPFYYVSGPGEIRNFAVHPQGWEKTDFNDTAWPAARQLFRGLPKDVQGPYGTTNGWMLRPSTIPQMEYTPERIPRVAESSRALPAGFPAKKQQVVIPPKTAVQILLDQSYLTNAYPVLEFSGGKNARIAMGYAEALYSEGYKKGNRNETAGKQFIGRTDSLISAGNPHQVFSPLSYRTYRYLQLRITTADQPLIIEDIYSIFSGYPFH